MTSPAPELLAWYHDAARDLPWRRTRDPYAIWVSEVMLQQTQVATVIPYWERWMARFPDVRALADAPEDEVLKRWEGLGYYSRARHLQAAARVIMAHHGGQVPATWDEVRRLPGVGDYTAGAILSIAFGQGVAAVDGNVLRVMSRLALVREDVTRPATRKAITGLVQALHDRCADASALTQALMELGATVCTPTRPRCDACPVARHCRALAAGLVDELPVKAGGRPPKAMVLGAALVEDGDRVLYVKRPAPGIWGGLWTFPAAELAGADPAHPEAAGPALAAALAAEGLEVELGPMIAMVRHTLTHRQLTIPVFRALRRRGTPRDVELAWAAPGAPAELALPVPFQKLVRDLDPGPLFRTGGHAG